MPLRVLAGGVDPRSSVLTPELLNQDLSILHRGHMEGYQRGGGEGSMGKKVQGIRSINGRYKIGGG